MERLPKKITIKAGSWVYSPQQGKIISSQLNADCLDFPKRGEEVMRKEYLEKEEVMRKEYLEKAGARLTAYNQAIARLTSEIDTMLAGQPIRSEIGGEVTYHPRYEEIRKTQATLAEVESRKTILTAQLATIQKD